jgi:hypothetical protein
MRIISIAALTVIFSGSAFACSFGGSDLFKPTLARWEQHPGPKQKNEKSEGDYWERVPAPVVRVVKITRGTTAPGSSCSDAGTLDLEISLPPESTYSINEFGIYFRVKSGKLPDAIFPDIPLVGEVKDGKVRLFLAWLDGHPKYQTTLNLEVEAFLVANDLSIGSSSTFLVQANKGG